MSNPLQEIVKRDFRGMDAETVAFLVAQVKLADPKGKYYWPKKACAHGHRAFRYDSNRSCIVCKMEARPAKAPKPGPQRKHWSDAELERRRVLKAKRQREARL